LVGRLSGIRTKSGQAKINDELTAYNLSANWEEFGPCPVFSSFTLAFALQLRKSTGDPQSGYKNLSQGRKNLRVGKTLFMVEKPSVRVGKTSVRVEKPSVRVGKTSVRVEKPSVSVEKTSIRIAKPQSG
jgi:hypothetical protein